MCKVALCDSMLLVAVEDLVFFFATDLPSAAWSFGILPNYAPIDALITMRTMQDAWSG